MEDPGCNVATALGMRMLVAVLYKCIFGTQLSPRLAMALSEEDWRIETGRHGLMSQLAVRGLLRQAYRAIWCGFSRDA